MKLISLLPINLREAEETEKDAEDTEGNPFAAGEDAGEEDASAEEGGDTGEADAEGGEEDEKKSEKESGSLDIVFDPNKVRKYNTQNFNGNRGTVVGVSRFGITVKLPDEKNLFVNFEDIL